MTDVFLVCFSLTDKESFKNALNKWIPELYQNANAPIILVGTKSDLKKEYEANPSKAGNVVSQSEVKLFIVSLLDYSGAESRAAT